MFTDNYLYFLRRLKAIRIDEPYLRARSMLHHWREKSRISADPEIFSVQRVWNRRDQWLALDRSADLAEAISPSSSSAMADGLWRDRGFWQTFLTYYGSEADSLISMAESAVNRVFRLFEWKEFDARADMSWSATMEPDRPEDVWPDSYHSDLSVGHDSSRPDRDIKWCWELNRFQHLLALGAAWRITGEERFARCARDHIDSWIRTVTYPCGVQWNSNLEVGLRALSWARCHMLCRDSGVWNHDFVSRFISSLYLHARHLENEFTLHHALSNHVLGEAAALFCISRWYPVFRDANRWSRRSLEILNRVAPLLLFPDGVYREQTTGYFRFVMEFLFPVLVLCRQDQVGLSGTVRERVDAGLRFVKNISPSPSDVPMIGDADTGLAIGWRLSDYWDFRPLLAAGAVVFERPELARGLSTFPAESFLLLGNEGRASFHDLRKSSNPVRESALNHELFSFADGGYQVSKDSLFHVIFDGGELGIPPGYGHGHLDGLSFQLSYQGHPAVIDTGTYLYNGPEAWRNYFRSARAHSAVTIDGKGPSTPLDTFRWKHGLAIRLGSPERHSGWTQLHGSLQWEGISHQRYLFHVHEEGVIVVDHLVGSGDHEITWRLQFHPDWDVEIVTEDRVSVKSGRDALEVAVLYGGAFDLSVLCGSTTPFGGWYSRYYGSKVPTATLVGTIRTRLPMISAVSIGRRGKDPAVPRGLPVGHPAYEVIAGLEIR